MLCACSSGEQFRFEEPPPKSPESLATRDFSVGGISSRTGDLKSLSSRTNGDLGSKYEDAHVDEVESTLKEALSLNYEEARALLGRIEYQKGNLDAAVQLFQGIDIKGLTPRMTTAIFERSRRKKMRSKGDDSLTGVMSWHSVSLFLEAILLKAKVYKELGRIKDAAKECKIILDIVESALPNGMPEGIGQDPKMQEMFHKALELLPKLWKQAGCIDEAITSYRRALIRPWNLDSERLAAVQKELASTLLYGGVETSLPSTLDPLTPTNNLEEAILLLFILMGKIAKMEITWDPEIMDHLTFALSVCGGFEFLADHIEQALPGFYSRAERWYILALCYSSSGQNDVALDLIKKAMGHSELNHKPHIPSCLFGAKLCAQDEKHARDGIRFSQMFIELASDEHAHLVGQARKFLGICYANAARTTMSKYERAMYQNECLDALDRAFSKDNEDPDLLFRIGLENAVQRNLEGAFEYVMRYSDEVAGSSVEGWKLLALVQSARERLSDAETIVEVALKEVTGTDQLELLKLKAVIQITSEEPRQAMETYGLLLAHIQAAKDAMTNLEAPALKQIEIEAWQDLAKMYTKFRSWRDAEICIDKARALEFYNPQSWHAAGSLFKQRSLQKQAMVAYSIALSIDPTHVPSIVGAAQVLTELGLHSHPIARSMLMNALQYDPVNYDAWLSLGSISNQEGLTELAAECFQAAVEVHSTRPVLPFR